MIDWGRIEAFQGYGRIDAPVVFLGMEEGGPADADKLMQDLLKRSSFSPSMPYEDPRQSIQRTWRVASHLMLRRAGNLAPTNADVLRYQQEQLGQPTGDTLLCELFPYPNNKISGWPVIYAARETRQEYMTRLQPIRANLLRRMLEQHPRELIICYGKGHWDRYAQIFGIELPAGKREAILISEWRGARVMFCHHFVSRHFNTLDAVNQFAKRALA
jgi:hypothetical protein